jgi:hypothetical protein
VTLAWLVLLLLCVIGAAIAWGVWTATRLDRLNLRREAAAAALRAQLMRRSSVAVELATTRLADGSAAAVILRAAVRARDASGDDLWIAQSHLTRILRTVELPDPAREPLVVVLGDAQRRVSMARRIHNDTAASAMALRGRRRVRWLRLAGRSQPPAMIEFDDATV